MKKIYESKPGKYSYCVIEGSDGKLYISNQFGTRPATKKEIEETKWYAVCLLNRHGGHHV